MCKRRGLFRGLENDAEDDGWWRLCKYAASRAGVEYVLRRRRRRALYPTRSPVCFVRVRRARKIEGWRYETRSVLAEYEQLPVSELREWN